MRAQEPSGRRREESTPEEMQGAWSRDHAGTERVGGRARPAEGVLTLVCFKCGTEYHFGDQEPPEQLTCEKCGNAVFRSFFSPVDDEAAQDFEDSTARDLDPDDPATETAPGDIADLNRD